MNKRMRLYGLLLVTALAYLTPCAAQQNDYLGRSPIPPSPEASSLGKYGDIPVSYYTGIPDISLPLTEIKDGKLSLPISLSYHAGGHKVNEVASWVGLGWTLNGPGVVTRVVRGFPDEINSNWNLYFNKPPAALFDGTHLTEQEKADYLAAANEGCIDLEKDFYFFNFNGNTGKFFFDWNGNLIVSSQRSVRIEPVFHRADSHSNATTLDIEKWIITDDQGNIYEFAEKEKSTQVSLTAWVPKCHSNSDKFTSSWYLTQIKDANQEDGIRLFYDDFYFEYPIVASEHKEYTFGGSPNSPGFNNSSVSRLTYASKRISSIRANNNPTVIDFFTSDEMRKDVSSEGGVNANVKALKNITVSYDGREEKVFHFIQTYATRRLTLEQVEELKGGRPIQPSYRFEYEGTLPDYKSTSQDHWGFYNTAGNTTLIPFRDLSPIDPRGRIIEAFGDGSIYGANRDPNFTGSVSGMLKSITYPTGGKTEFTYELNDYSFVQSQKVDDQNIFLTNMKRASVIQTAKMSSETGSSVATTNLNLPDDTPVRIRMYGYPGSSAATENTKPRVTLLDASGKEIIRKKFNFDGVNNFQEETAYLALPPGQYTLQAKAPAPSLDENPYVAMDIDYFTKVLDPLTHEPKKVVTKQAGGVRIKEMKDIPGTGLPIIKRFKYVLSDSPEKSSGAIFHEAKYIYEIKKIVSESIYDPNTGITYFLEREVQTFVRLAQNRSIIGETQGSHIGYSEVQVEQGDGIVSNGKTIYKFTSPIEFGEGVSEDFPFPSPSSSQAHKTGLLKEQIDLKLDNGSFVPVRKVTNTYNFTDYNVQSRKIGYLGGQHTGVAFLDRYILGNYQLNTGFSQLTETKEEWLYPNNSIINLTQLEYDANLQNVKRKIQQTGDDSQRIDEFLYPQDYLNPHVGVGQMLTYHMVGIPVEIITKRKEIDIETIIGGKYNRYVASWQYTDFAVRLVEEMKLSLSQPLPVADFVYSNTTSNEKPDGRYESIVKVDLYDDRSRPIQVSFRSGQVKSYIWDYFGESPSAEITGAQVRDVAYTSFESDRKGQWVYNSSGIDDGNFRTGKKGYKLSAGSISRANLNPSKAYIVSFWAKGESPVCTGTLSSNGETVEGWTYYEYHISGATSFAISGTATVDELRLYPWGAQMTSYTVDPLIGTTSANDANNRITFYEYELNRLKLIKDSDYNVKKLFNYQFKTR